MRSCASRAATRACSAASRRSSKPWPRPAFEAEVVPGVTAAIAAAAALQRPLTRRGAGRSVALTTAMSKTGELRAARSADTEVFYMAGRQLGALSRRLVDAGWDADTPVAVVSRAGWPDQIASDHSRRLAGRGRAAAQRAADRRDGLGVGARPVANLRQHKFSKGASTGAPVAQS